MSGYNPSQLQAYDTLKDLSDRNIQLELSRHHAYHDSREGPLYGFWGIKQDMKLINIERRKLSMTVPIFFPQHPVSFNVVEDYLYPTPPASELPSRRSSMPMSQELHFSPPQPHSTSDFTENAITSTPPQRQKYSQPPSTPAINRILESMPSFPLLDYYPFSPLAGRGRGKYPSTSTSIEGSISSLLRFERGGLDMALSGPPTIRDQQIQILREAAKFRSTRIPDFLRRIFKIWDGGQRAIFDLIFEVKRAGALYHDKAVKTSMQIQVQSQANHIFATDPAVQHLGCIIAIGEHWNYQELHRYIVPGDNDYDGDSLHSETSSTRIPLQVNSLGPDPLLEEVFKNGKVISLSDPSSDELMSRVCKRLRSFNPSYWEDIELDSIDTFFPPIIEKDEEDVNEENSVLLRSRILYDELDDWYIEEDSNNISN